MDLLAEEVSFCSLAHGKRGLEFTRQRSSIDAIAGYFKKLTEEFELSHYTVDR